VPAHDSRCVRGTHRARSAERALPVRSARRILVGNPATKGLLMPGRVQGKVAFITGAARGQGRSHAVRLAEEGADVIAVDLAGPVPSVSAYPPATADDLAETVKQVEALDRRIVAHQADVRDPGALRAASTTASRSSAGSTSSSRTRASTSRRPPLSSTTPPGRKRSASTSPASGTPSRPRCRTSSRAAAARSS